MPNKHLWLDRQKPADPTEPKPRGGAKSRHPNSIANLKSWPKGVSGNPSGKSTSINEVMRLARSRCCEAIEKLTEIMRDPDADHKNVIAACLAIMDRGMGKAIVPVFKGGPCGLPEDMVNGSDEVTPLLTAAGRGAGDAYKRALQSELDRLETEERQMRAARRNEVEEAAAALRRGEDIEPSMRMLIEVKDSTS